jgi:hypothetical protein
MSLNQKNQLTTGNTGSTGEKQVACTFDCCHLFGEAAVCKTLIVFPVVKRLFLE